jgi:D-3-phosphoglycerate dehydrogenase
MAEPLNALQMKASDSCKIQVIFTAKEQFMATYKVVVVNLGYESYEIERRLLEPLGAELVLAPEDCTTEEDVIAIAEDADAILVREAPISRKVLESLTRCRIVSRYGVGVDNVDLDFARKRKIRVSNVPGYGTEEVSDHTVALLLACIRRIPVRDRNLRQGVFETDINDRIYRSAGKVLGLIGYGLIGRAVCRKWQGFLPERILVHDPYAVAEQARADGAQLTDLDTLLRESDYISLHAPLTPETRHVINAASLKKMKPSAIVINTARGGLIDESALIEALKEDRILAAGLDVFEREPLAPDHPLLQLSNVVLSGHVGWYSKDAVAELQTRAAKEVVRALSGHAPECWVNRW